MSQRDATSPIGVPCGVDHDARVPHDPERSAVPENSPSSPSGDQTAGSGCGATAIGPRDHKPVQDRSARVKLRRGVTLLAMTLVLPGSAQLVAGNRRIGRIALRVWAGVMCGQKRLGDFLHPVS